MNPVWSILNKMKRIRNASLKDLEQVTEVEAVCFPVAEAADGETFRARLTAFPGHFLVMEEESKIIGFINGMVTDQESITDEMFGNAGLHRESGRWQSVFGLDVLPEYRRCGLAGQLMNSFIEAARQEGRSGCILTCKDRLIPYYEKFGYRKTGLSASVHGGAVWYDMKLEF